MANGYGTSEPSSGKTGARIDALMELTYELLALEDSSPLKKYKFSEARKKKDWLWYRLVRKIKETSRKQRRRAVKEAGDVDEQA